MDRLLFYGKTRYAGSTVEELDYLYTNMDKFKMSYRPGYYRLIMSDIMRPDLISYRVYGTVDNWWLLLYVNKTNNALLDMKVGDIWQIPNQTDIYTFIKKYKVR